MHDNKRKSLLQERRAAADVGGTLQPGSGAPVFYKGDVRVMKELRLECKTTSKGSYSLKLQELEKIKGEAFMGGDEVWAMQIEFQAMTAGRKFAVIDWQTFLDLRERAKNNE